MNQLRVEHRLIQILLGTVGSAAILIGAMIFSFGVLWTLHFFESLFNFATGQTIAPEPTAVAVTIDNEFRFYSVFWLSYGALLLWTAWEIQRRWNWVPILFGLFFLGGIGRVISHLTLGAPHPLFVVLMGTELAIPVVAALLYARTKPDVIG